MDFNNMPSKETVSRLRAEYPVGTRIELVYTDDPHTRLRTGDRGSVKSIDDTGTVFAAWDNSSGLGLLYGVDAYKKVEHETDRSPETHAPDWDAEYDGEDEMEY